MPQRLIVGRSGGSGIKAFTHHLLTVQPANDSYSSLHKLDNKLTVSPETSWVRHSQLKDCVSNASVHLSTRLQCPLKRTQSSQKQHPPCWLHAQQLSFFLEANHLLARQILGNPLTVAPAKIYKKYVYNYVSN